MSDLQFIFKTIKSTSNMGHESCSVSETEWNDMFSQINCYSFELLFFCLLCAVTPEHEGQLNTLQLAIRQVS